MRRYIALLLMIIAAATWSQGNAFARQVRVAIAPFTVNSQEDLAYVQAGILALLPSRISVPGKISVIDSLIIKRNFFSRGTIIPLDQIILKAGKMDIDFIITGSITKIGDKISIDSTLVDIIDPDHKISLYIQPASLENIIPEISGFAEKAKKYIIEGPEIQEHGVYKSPEAKRGSTPMQSRITPAVNQPVVLEESSIFDIPDTSTKPAQKKADMFAFKTEPVSDFTFKSKPMHCIASGDLNGNGRQELILSGVDSIEVFAATETGFKKLYEIKTMAEEYIIHIDTADLNKDNKDEIYVSSYQGRYANSFVLEFTDDSNQSTRTAEDLKWFFRSDMLPDGRKILIGQRVDLADPFSENIHRFMLKDGKPAPGQEIIVPGGVGIYAFSEADTDNDGNKEYIVFSKSSFNSTYKLHILSYTGRIKWLDLTKLGGSTSHFPVAMYAEDDMPQMEFMPMRILCEDLNNDGTAEIIVAKNSKKGKGLINKIVFFNQAEMFCMNWNGSDLASSWKSSLIHDYITDYMLADFNGDGRRELYVLSVAEEGMWGKATNRITCFDQ